MIAIENVSKRFRDKLAVNGVSFTALAGEVTGLIGANGSGKTTIMRMIATVYKPSAGNISVCGVDVKKNPAGVRKNIGVLLGGDISLYKRFTAYENIEYYALLQGMSKTEAKQSIEVLSETLGIKDYLYRKVDGFSRGMRQRVAFARAIAHDPQVILLDEPSTGLDIYSIRDVQNFIISCKKRGKTILLSTHNVSEMENLCDKVAVLDNGSKIFEGDIQSLMSDMKSENLMDAFFKLVGCGEEK